MKIQIDTTAKILKIEESVNLGDFIEFLSALFPNDAWKEFKLETKVITNWNSPIVIERERPAWPSIQPWITYLTQDKAEIPTNTDYPEETIYSSNGLLNFQITK